MPGLHEEIRPFARRVRLLKGWHGAAMGLAAGSLAALVWSALDWAGVAYADWRGLAAVAGAGTLAGLVAGLLARTSELDLARSIDRRGSLKDRLGTALEPRAATPFDELQAEDANRAVASVEPKRLYPVRFGRWHAAALACAVLAASTFLLGNSPIVRGPKTAAERQELKEIGQKVERVAKPVEKPVKGVEVPPNAQKTAQQIDRFAKELQDGKINKEQALRKANDLAKKAEEDAKESAKSAEQSVEQAQTALGKYERMKLDEAGVKAEDLERLKLSPEQQSALDKAMKDQGFENPKSKFSDKELKDLGVDRTAEKLAGLSKEQREQLRNALSKQQEALQKEMDRIDRLPESERKKLEAQRQEMQRQMQELQQLSEKLKLSEDALQAMKELMESEEGQKLREMMEKMQQNAQQMQQGQPMSKEQLEQLKKQMEQFKQQMEQFAKDWKDPAKREEIKRQMEEAMKQLEQAGMSAQQMQGLMEAFGMQDPNGNPGTGKDDMFSDTGKVVKSEHERENKGKTTTTSVKGDWRDKGDQWSVTIKAPTQVGNRSSVPYQKVLPKFKSAAEKAVASGKIPKDQEKRVKEYFESLSGGGR